MHGAEARRDAVPRGGGARVGSLRVARGRAAEPELPGCGPVVSARQAQAATGAVQDAPERAESQSDQAGKLNGAGAVARTWLPPGVSFRALRRIGVAGQIGQVPVTLPRSPRWRDDA